MMEIQKKEVLGGIFMLVGFAIILMLTIFVGQKHGILERKITYSVLFDEVSGLQEGASVFLAGVEVGFVKNIELVYRDNKPWVRVSAVILAERTDQIRQDSQFKLSTKGVLGDTVLKISSGTKEKEPLPAGAEIIGESPYSFLKLTGGFDQVVVEIEKLSQRIDTFLSSASKNMDLIQPELTQTAQSIRRSSASFDKTLREDGPETLKAVRDASLSVQRFADDLDDKLKKGQLFKVKVF